MAYGRIYIDNLHKKVTALFDELREENHLCESAFIEVFQKEYPKDYAMLQYEWEFKVHEFKKNRKGNPKAHPIRPEKILSNMYRNYYFKLVKNPIIQRDKLKQLNKKRAIAGKYGYKIEIDKNGKYNVIKKTTKEIVRERIDFAEVKYMFSVLKLQKNNPQETEEEQSNEC